MGAPQSQTFCRLYFVFVLLLLFIIVTLRGLPHWRPHIQTNSWTDVALDVGLPFFAKSPANDTSATTDTSTEALRPQITFVHRKNGSESLSAGKDVEQDGIQELASDKAEGESNFELVISHYKADTAFVKMWVAQIREIPYIKQLGLKLTIYSKWPGVDLQRLKRETGADEVHSLPNIGREGETMLHHIIKNYENPTKFTMFSQAEPQWTLDDDDVILPWYKKKLYKDFRPNTGYLGLNEWNEICTCGNCGGLGQFPLQVAIHDILEQEICHGENWNGLWGQFIVSGTRIQSRPLKAYKWLHSMIAAPADHWIHAEKEPALIKHTYTPAGSVPDNPLFGHTLERSWTTIFNCSIPTEEANEESGIVEENVAHCWDWTIPHYGSNRTQPEHWPGFEAIDAEWEVEEEALREKHKEGGLSPAEEMIQNHKVQMMEAKEPDNLVAGIGSIEHGASDEISEGTKLGQWYDNIFKDDGAPKKDLRANHVQGTTITELS